MNDDDIERRLHARTVERSNAQKAAWIHAVNQRKAKLVAWIADNASKLGRMPAAVRAEVESCAWDRIKADKDVNLTLRDVRDAEARVVSRLRIRTYGAMPDSPDEFRRQCNEMRGSLGLPSLDPRAEAA